MRFAPNRAWCAVFTLALAVPLIAGCATPTPDAAPAGGTAVPAAWSSAAPGPGLADAEWWNSFHDPLLTRLVAQAVRHNTRIGVALANVREARALRTQAAAGAWPSLGAALDAQRASGAGATAARRVDASLDAAWEADIFGATRHGIAAQEALLRASAATLDATRVSVAGEVALAYIDVRNAQARTAIARGNLATQEETLQIARWREQAGLASSLEVEQAATTVAQTRAAIPLLQSSQAASAHALAVLTGEPPHALLAALAAPAPWPEPSAAAVPPPAETLRRRPDVRAAEERVRAAAQQTAQADANRYPSLTLRASADWAGLTLGSLGSVAAARSIVASLAAPVFDAGLRGAQLEQQRARFDAAQQEWRAAVLGALQDVEDALAALQAARERLASLRAAQESASNASMLATYRYSSGVIDFLTVLETQRTLLTVQDAVAVAQAELAAGHVRLFKALGGSWPQAATENPS